MISLNPILEGYLGLYGAAAIAEAVLLYLNAARLRRNSGGVPPFFEGVIDRAALDRINRYQLENIRFSLVETGFGKCGFLLVLLSGLLPWGAQALSGMNPVWAGILFFEGLGLGFYLATLPFSYYHAFVIEQRHGFNTATVRTWLGDQVKSLVLSSILGAFLLGGILCLVELAGRTWWLWAWAFFFGFQIIMTALYPMVIAPLFNRFTLLDDPELSERIQRLLRAAGLQMVAIYRMDASKRSRHTNAYLAGIGRKKRVVLFDSLLQSHDRNQIVAILAHELGHGKLGHIWKQLLLIGVLSLGVFFAASGMLIWDPLYQCFGFAEKTPYVGLFLTGVVWAPVGFWAAPLVHWNSRRFELQADAYGVRMMKDRETFSEALRKLAVDNLTNLNPHPAYVWFNHSHPPLAARIGQVEQVRLEL